MKVIQCPHKPVRHTWLLFKLSAVVGRSPTVAVGHAVEEEPGRVAAAVLDKGHVVTGFDAQHGEQLHPLAGKGALPTRSVRQLLGHRQLPVPVTLPPGVEVNLDAAQPAQSRLNKVQSSPMCPQ